MSVLQKKKKKKKEKELSVTNQPANIFCSFALGKRLAWKSNFVW